MRFDIQAPQQHLSVFKAGNGSEDTLRDSIIRAPSAEYCESSDTSVKLWRTAAGRCRHNLQEVTQDELFAKPKKRNHSRNRAQAYTQPPHGDSHWSSKIRGGKPILTEISDNIKSKTNR